MVQKTSALTALLLERCRGGDAAAWEELVHTHSRWVYNVCYRSLGSAEDAHDLTQDVFIKTYRRLGQYDPTRAAFPTWLAAIVRNTLADHFRRAKPDRFATSIDAQASSDDEGPLGESEPAEFMELIASSPSPHDEVAARDLQATVQRALLRPPPALREVIILRDLEDLDYGEIAAALNLPVGTVKSRISRGRAELARLLSRTYNQVLAR